MAHANPYAPSGSDIGTELAKIAASLQQIIDNQKIIQRDDGCLKDCSVLPHTLSEAVMNMIGHFELLGDWQKNQPYLKGQMVNYNGRVFVCMEDHAGTEAMDYAKFKAMGQSGCGCSGGGGGCAPKQTYVGEFDGTVSSANGCLQKLTVPIFGFKELNINVEIENGEDILVIFEGLQCVDEASIYVLGRKIWPCTASTRPNIEIF